MKIVGTTIFTIGIAGVIAGFFLLFSEATLPAFTLGGTVFNPNPGDVILFSLIVMVFGSTVSVLLTDKTPIRDH